MNILYSFLITIPFSSIIATLLFALVENLKLSTKMKISIMTFGHPVLTGIIIWFICSPINKEIADTGVLIIVGGFLFKPFSDKKYFSSLVNEEESVKIEYFSELLQRKTINLKISEITNFSQRTSKKLIDKPSELIVTTANQIFKFNIIDKTSNPSL